MYNGYTGGYGGYSPAVYQGQSNQPQRTAVPQEQPYTMYGGNVMYQQGNVQQIIKGRPVSSYDEAKASMIDLDGSLFVFPDVANKRIYTKQIMLDGSADFRVYVLQEQTPAVMQGQEAESDRPTYVLKKDFDKAVGDLKKQIKALKAGVGNVTTANADNVQ